MANNNQHIHYSKSAIEKYLQGKMTHAEMYALEKAALQDPFLADAIEGFAISDFQKANDAIENTNFLIQSNIQNNSLSTNYTIHHIEAYYNGNMTSTERNAIEKAALKDALLADAMEGYENSNFSNAKQRLTSIAQQIQGKEQQTAKVVTISQSTNNKQWLRIAAAIILMVGVGTTIWWVNNQKAVVESHIAYVPEEVKASSATTTPSAVIAQPDAIVKVPDAVASTKTEKAKPTIPNTGLENAGTGGSAALTTDAIKDETALINTATADQIAKAEVDKKQAAIKEQIERTRSKEATTKLDPAQPAPSVASSSAENKRVAEDAAIVRNNYNNGSNTFRGRVSNTNGEALASTTFNLRSSNNNIIARTDKEGNFAVQLPDTNAIVAVETLGYHQQQTNLSANRSNNIVLERGSEASLSETVVIGYGTAKKKANQTAAQKAIEEELRNKGSEPIGGWQSFNQYLQQKLSILKSEEDDVVEDDSFNSLKIEFKVNTDGTPVNVQVEGSKNEKFTQKAIEIIKQGPKWKAAKKSKKVKLTVQL
jgi:hypothetical protein